MARYTEAQCRRCRRECRKLYLKGIKCDTPKCPVDRRGYPPGQHGKIKAKLSPYAVQLRAKQTVKRVYGILERQFRKYFEIASQQKGVTGDLLLQMLERRLDNVVYRLGLAYSRSEARQLVTHGHFVINGYKQDIPSYLVKVGDVITLKEKSKELPRFKCILEEVSGRAVPKWLEFDANNTVGKVVSLPTEEDVDIDVEMHLIVELYSK